MKQITEIRSKRVTEGITAIVLSQRAGVDRCRLSFLERGHAQPTEDELSRLNSALDELLKAKRKMQDFAASVGWPVGV